jgi:SAM-dependent methyltransferase
MDWKTHFTQNPTLFEETEFFKQVEKTLSGQPISPAQFEAQISDLRKALEISKDDRVLDMCCGNGIVTAEISKDCYSIIGIDFSEPLIKLAKKYKNPANTAYYCLSVLDQNVDTLLDKSFSKIYMSDSLQYFNEEDLSKILQLILKISSSNPIIFFGGVPDIDKIWNFYDTEERREDYRRRKSMGNEAIGTWWKKNSIKNICLQNGFESEFLSQNKLVYSAHYRFDVRLHKFKN